MKALGEDKVGCEFGVDVKSQSTEMKVKVRDENMSSQ